MNILKQCPYCFCYYSKDKHIKKSHPDLIVEFIKCSECNSIISSKKIRSHLKNMHKVVAPADILNNILEKQMKGMKYNFPSDNTGLEKKTLINSVSMKKKCTPETIKSAAMIWICPFCQMTIKEKREFRIHIHTEHKIFTEDKGACVQLREGSAIYPTKKKIGLSIRDGRYVKLWPCPLCGLKNF